MDSPLRHTAPPAQPALLPLITDFWLSMSVSPTIMSAPPLFVATLSRMRAPRRLRFVNIRCIAPPDDASHDSIVVFCSTRRLAASRGEDAQMQPPRPCDSVTALIV